MMMQTLHLIVRRLFPVLALCGATVMPSLAQKPFSRISLRGGAASNLDNGRLHDRWERGRGGELVFSTPFYTGEAELGGALHRYDALSAEVPRFDAILAFVGWGVDLIPFDIVTWEAGVRVGTYRMAFDEETFAGVKNESELSLGLTSRLEIHLSRTISIYASGFVLRTYTDPRFDLAYGTGGLALTFDSPAWLQTILR